jgi:hypothetical protein
VGGWVGGCPLGGAVLPDSAPAAAPLQRLQSLLAQPLKGTVLSRSRPSHSMPLLTFTTSPSPPRPTLNVCTQVAVTRATQLVSSARSSVSAGSRMDDPNTAAAGQAEDAAASAGDLDAYADQLADTRGRVDAGAPRRRARARPRTASC